MGQKLLLRLATACRVLCSRHVDVIMFLYSAKLKMHWPTIWPCHVILPTYNESSRLEEMFSFQQSIREHFCSCDMTDSVT